MYVEDDVSGRYVRLTSAEVLALLVLLPLSSIMSYSPPHPPRRVMLYVHHPPFQAQCEIRPVSSPWSPFCPCTFCTLSISCCLRLKHVLLIRRTASSLFFLTQSGPFTITIWANHLHLADEAWSKLSSRQPADCRIVIQSGLSRLNSHDDLGQRIQLHCMSRIYQVSPRSSRQTCQSVSSIPSVLAS